MQLPDRMDLFVYYYRVEIYWSNDVCGRTIFPLPVLTVSSSALFCSWKLIAESYKQNLFAEVTL